MSIIWYTQQAGCNINLLVGRCPTTTTQQCTSIKCTPTPRKQREHNKQDTSVQLDEYNCAYTRQAATGMMVVAHGYISWSQHARVVCRQHNYQSLGNNCWPDAMLRT